MGGKRCLTSFNNFIFWKFKIFIYYKLNSDKNFQLKIENGFQNKNAILLQELCKFNYT